MAQQPCRIVRLPDSPTLADLEAGYITRGMQIAECDLARRLALGTLEAERRAIDAAVSQVRQ